MDSKRIENIVQSVRDKYAVHGRSFTKRDFYRICKGERIRLMRKSNYPETAAPHLHEFPWVHGIYFRVRHGRNRHSAIYLRCFWQETFDLFVAFHEIGHHFCGVPTQSSGLDLAFADHDAYRNHPTELAADEFAELCTGLKRQEAADA